MEPTVASVNFFGQRCPSGLLIYEYLSDFVLRKGLHTGGGGGVGAERRGGGGDAEGEKFVH